MMVRYGGLFHGQMPKVQMPKVLPGIFLIFGETRITYEQLKVVIKKWLLRHHHLKRHKSKT